MSYKNKVSHPKFLPLTIREGGCKKSGFTLVELIVVITILAILGTIAFISLQGYSANSRDSVRISDVSMMKTSLELFHIDAGKYPLPDNPGIATYSGQTLWTQGTFGNIVRETLGRNISKTPLDPLLEKEYIYSVTNSRNEFQILNLLEGDLVLNFAINKTNAASILRTPKVSGQYNGVFVRTANYIVPVPSIITSETLIEGGELKLDNINIKSQIIEGGKNIPKLGNIKSATGQLVGLELSVYNGATITKNSTDQQKIVLLETIKAAYSGSILSTKDIYNTILTAKAVDMPGLIDVLVLDNGKALADVKDTTAPVGGSFIMSGTTSTTSITLNITCPNEIGTEMYVSGTGVLSLGNIWETCTAIKAVTLTTGDGTKNVTMKFRDSVGNESLEIINNIDFTLCIYEIIKIFGYSPYRTITINNACGPIILNLITYDPGDTIITNNSGKDIYKINYITYGTNNVNYNVSPINGISKINAIDSTNWNTLNACPNAGNWWGLWTPGICDTVMNDFFKSYSFNEIGTSVWISGGSVSIN